MPVTIRDVVDFSFEGGSHLLDPVGGRANGMPNNWRTLGADELMNPLSVPLFVSTWRIQLEVVAGMQLPKATTTTRAVGTAWSIKGRISPICDVRAIVTKPRGRLGTVQLNNWREYNCTVLIW
jgi:hypothetical protein